MAEKAPPVCPGETLQDTLPTRVSPIASNLLASLDSSTTSPLGSSAEQCVLVDKMFAEPGEERKGVFLPSNVLVCVPFQE